MSKEQEDKIDAGTPALFVLCGATRKKWRPLAGDVVMLGRSPGCDIGLVSPEVAPVHCLIVRTVNGWRIRDCSGRATRVNGKAIQDEPLHNGDVLQIGTFSFEAKLPSVAAHAVAAPAVAAAVQRSTVVGSADAKLDRLHRSRRRLADLALGMRRRLREYEDERQTLEHQRNDLEQLERRLRNSHQEHQSRQEKSSEHAAQAAARQAELDTYAAHLRRQAEGLAAEKEKAAREGEIDRADFEADLVRQRVELNQQQESLTQWQHSLASRHTELESMANQLTEVLQHERDQLEAYREQMNRDREQMNRDREQMNHDREQIVREREALEKQRIEIEHLRVEPSSSRETRFENGEPDRLASARKLLHDLQQRRKSSLKLPGRAGVAPTTRQVEENA